uniref:uncharacterized protein LOC122604757 n=1 Tax=Erigeron canadensis TaxID=72917 RepID=UPI001CB8E2C7|nr:uncharacterized protein LOC122604757 [Erigeron canadensis]
MGHEINKIPSKPTTGISKRCRRQVEDAGEVECSDKSSSSSSISCKSCTARVIADCVAICCCPCALVNFFTLTLVKVPYMMGRKYLSNLSKKKKLKNDQEKGGNISKKDETSKNQDLGEVVTAIVESENEEELMESSNNKYSARFEAERVWLELYRVDHLGFGRVSFNGIQSLG